MDSVYRFSIPVSHTGSSVELAFTGSGLQHKGDESWGLDNVVVVSDYTNRSPTAIANATSTPEDTPVVIDVLANDYDPDGDALSVVSVDTPAHGSVSADGGVLTYTPSAGWVGHDVFTYQIADGQGGSATASVNVEVTARPIANGDSASTPQNTPVIIDVSDNDTVAPGGAASAAGISVPPANGTAGLYPFGGIVYTPNEDWTGADTFEYVLSDGLGGITTGTVTVTVDPVAGANFATDDSATTTIGLPITVHVLGNDTLPTGSVVSELLLDSESTNGLVQINPDGSIEYIPLGTFEGPDSFTYTVITDTGAADSAEVVVTVSGPPPDDNVPPTGTPDSYRLDLDRPGVLISGNVLTNDTDADGDTLTGVLVAGPAYAQAGSFTFDSATGQFGYALSDNLPHDFPGYDTFTYYPDDGTSVGNVVEVRIDVLSGGFAFDDYYRTDGSSSVIVDAAGGVLANDDVPNGVDVTAELLTAPPPDVGQVFLDPDGGFTFIPGVNFDGIAEFVYARVRQGIDAAAEFAAQAVATIYNNIYVASRTQLERLTFVTDHPAIWPDAIGPMADRLPTAPYKPPHWLDSNRNGTIDDTPGEQRVPVSFTRGTKPGLGVVAFQIPDALADAWKVKGVHLRAQAQTPDGILTVGHGPDNLLTVRVAKSGGKWYVLLDEAEFDTALIDKTAVYKDLQLVWELAVPTNVAEPLQWLAIGSG